MTNSEAIELLRALTFQYRINDKKYCRLEKIDGYDFDALNLAIKALEEKDILYAKHCVVDYANELTDYIINQRENNPHFDISNILAYLTKSKYEYTPSEYICTGHTDTNGTPIYVGDVVKEGCNGLVAKVVLDFEKGYLLEGLGEGYGIENAHIEWEVQEPSIYSQIQSKETLASCEDLER